MLIHDLGVEVFRIRREHQARPATADRRDLLVGLAAVDRIARTNAFDPVLPIVAGVEADILLAAHRPAEALDAAERGFAALGTRRQREQAVPLFVARAEALAALGRWGDVLSTCREAIEFVEKRRRRVSPLALASAYLAFRVRLYELGVHAALQQEDLPLALSLGELVKARSLTNLRRAADGGTGDVDAMRAEFREIGRTLDAGHLPAEEIEALRARRGALWDLITIERLRAREAGGVDFSIETLQRSLAPDEAVLSYFWVGDTALAVTVLTRDDAAGRVETLAASERAELMALGRAALSFDQESVADSVVPGRAVAERLLPEWVRRRVRDKHRLLISPHRVLHSIPFHALVVDGAFVIERWAVTYVPNLTSLLWSFPAPSAPRVLLVAAPSHEGSARAGLPYLRDAVAEVEDVGALYRESPTPVRTLLPGEATEAMLHQLHERGELQTFTVLHFACHGENVDESVPMESRLFLRDAALDGLDIANWNLRADVLVLSACASGQRPIGGRDFTELPGDDLFGLQAAFFIAGVRQIVSALWPVESWAARRICADFHRHLQTMPTEVALQRALTAFIAAGPLCAEPSVWAPFFLVRAAGARPAA